MTRTDPLDRRRVSALDLVARLDSERPGAAIPVAAVGLVFGTHDYFDRPVANWERAACAVYSANVALATRHASLRLALDTSPAPAATGQPSVFAKPLAHYLSCDPDRPSRLYDPAQTGNQPHSVAVRVDGLLLIANGTHRYAAARLLGLTPPLLVVAGVPDCSCPARHSPASRSTRPPHTRTT